MNRDPLLSYLELGVVAKPHGVRGAVKIKLYNPSSSSLDGCREAVFVQPHRSQRAAFRVVGVSGDYQILQIEGVSRREEADALRGARLFVERDALQPLEEEQYYCADLVGCEVVDERSGLLGIVSQVFFAGASEVLVVRDGQAERMIPLVEEWVISVDLERRRIDVTGGDQWEPQLLPSSED